MKKQLVFLWRHVRVKKIFHAFIGIMHQVVYNDKMFASWIKTVGVDETFNECARVFDRIIGWLHFSITPYDVIKIGIERVYL